MKVVDASALVEILLGTPRGERADSIIGDDAGAAPELICVEVTSAIARLVRAGAVGAADAERAIAVFERTEVDLVPQRDLIGAAWALRDRVRITDAFYVACAKTLDAELVTCDGPLSRAPLPDIVIRYVT